MLVSWLLNAISPNLRGTISYFDDVHELWQHLKERFSVSNGTQICQLKSQISECKQALGESLALYYW